MCINGLNLCMYVHMSAWCPWRSEKGIRSPTTGVLNDCEPPILVAARLMCLDLLQEQQMLCELLTQIPSSFWLVLLHRIL